jgi:transcriptional regulator with XRE-family HTH domain
MPSRQLVKRTYPKRWQAPDMSLMADVGARFRIARKALKLTQEELAKQLNVEQTSISRFEGGKRGLETPVLLGLFRIAAEAGMNIDGYVLRGVGEPIRREPVLIASSPEMLEELRTLSERLAKKSR